jgi:hypothetical protein
MKTTRLRHLLVIASLLFAAGCSPRETTPLPPSGPHGGPLADVGSRKYALEFLLDRTEGHLTLYTLDARAAEAIRTGSEGLELRVRIGDNPQERFLILAPIANSATGEFAGDTTRYAGDAPWLKTREAVSLNVVEIIIRGRKYRDITGFIPAEN